jgi:hypothetical protein
MAIEAVKVRGKVYGSSGVGENRKNGYMSGRGAVSCKVLSGITESMSEG